MSPKLVQLNGKNYIKSDEGGDLEEVKDEGAVEETPAEETPAEAPAETPKETPAEAPASTDADIDAAAEKAADAIVAKLPIDKLTKAIEGISAREVITPTAKSIVGKELTEKEIKDMPAREKIVKFFKAVVQKDDVMAKALSEGTAADGGLRRYSPLMCVST